MKYLGIDYGAKRIGIAISDEDGKIAFPRETIPNDGKILELIGGIVEKEKIGHIIVGDTRSHGGAENPVTEEAEAFVEKLKRATGLPVARAFEAWSTIEASRYSPDGKSHDDASAAAIILQRYLDMHR